MTRWRDANQQMDMSLLCKFSFYLESAALQWIPVLLLKYAPLCACFWYNHHHSLCIFGVTVQMKSVKLKTTLTTPVVYIMGCMLGIDLIQGPPNQILSVHWDTTGQTTLEDRWSHKYTGMPLQTTLADASTLWRPSVNLHNWNTMEDHWSHNNTRMALEPQSLMLDPRGVPVAIQC